MGSTRIAYYLDATFSASITASTGLSCIHHAVISCGERNGDSRLSIQDRDQDEADLECAPTPINELKLHEDVAGSTESFGRMLSLFEAQDSRSHTKTGAVAGG